MRERIFTLGALPAAIGLFVAASALRTSASALRRPEADRAFEAPAIPAEVARPLAFGFRSFVGHLAYLEAIQVYGDRHKRRDPVQEVADDRLLVRLMQYATDLDEKFVGAYRFAAAALPRETTDGKAYNVLATVQMLKKGARERPDSWHLSFLLGFLQSYYLGEMEEAAKHLAHAARQKGAPQYLGLLASRLAADAGKVEVAEQLAHTMLEQAEDDESRGEWQKRLVEVRMERDLRAIEEAAQRFRAQAGHFPRAVDELVVAGLLPRDPVEPHGGRYVIDPQTGAPRSTAAARLRVRGRPNATAGLEVH